MAMNKTTLTHTGMLFALVSAAILVGCGQRSAAPDTAVAATQQSEFEFRDCEDCPVMVCIPAGSFRMGAAAQDRLIDPRAYFARLAGTYLVASLY